MASKVLVPGPFTSLQVKKTQPEPNGSGFYIGSGDSAARIAHLEHSVRFLQEQHRQMLSGLHNEIESLRERNRDLQFQLIFNKEPTRNNATTSDDAENQVSVLRLEVETLEHEATVARSEATAFERKAMQLQQIVDEQALKLRELEQRNEVGSTEEESRAELRARLAEAERLVRRLRTDAERQRREVHGGAGVTNLLFDGAAAHHAHCMKHSLIRAGGIDAFGFQNFQYPHMHSSDFWREPLREEYSMGSRGRHHRRPNTLPELAANGQHIRSTVFANHARVRSHLEKVKKSQAANGETQPTVKNSEETDHPTLNPVNTDNLEKTNDKHVATYPELKVVVTKIIPHGNVNTATSAEARSKTRRPHRKNGTEHT